MKKTIATIGIGAVAISMGTIEASAMEKGTINTSALNIRSGPGTNYNKIDKVYKGETVEILEQSAGWYKVKLQNKKIGWGSGSYINTNSQGTDQATQPSAIKKAKITASTRLNIRSGAGTSYSVLGKLNNGEIVEVLGQSNGWYKIKASNGLVGWGSGQYISSTTGENNNNNNNDNTQNSTPLQNKKGKITANPSLNIRNGAGTSYSVVGKSKYGEVVELLEKSNGWYKVKLSSGLVGWGSGSYIVETTVDSGTQTPEKPSQPVAPTEDRTQVVNLAYSLIGKGYAWGAEGPNTFDCSGFTKYVYSKAQGKTIPRVSREQARYGSEVGKGNFEPGDLVYFDTDKDGVVNHVGVYVGGNEFIHASGTPTNPDSVRKDSLSTSFWTKALLGARRF